MGVEVMDPGTDVTSSGRLRARRVTRPGGVLAVAVLGTFMAFVDATIVNIAVPDIAHTFSGAHLSGISWVLNAYNIVFAAFLVGGGQLADLLGRRRVFSISLALFTLASAACAVAPTLGLLVAARVVQAAGAALLVPSSLAIVLHAHGAERRMHAVALWSAVAALGAGIGPPLGGLLITASSWRLVFLVNIPVGLVAFALAQRVLVESRASGRRRMPDLIGAVTLALAIAALVLAVVKGQEWGWGSVRVISAFASSALLGAYFVVRSSGHRNPLVDMSLLRIRAFSLSNGVTIVMAAGFYSYTLCNVLFLTGVWRYSILKAGLALTPGPFTAIAVAGPASRLVARVGHRAVLVPGALVWAAGVIFFATALGRSADFVGQWLPGMVILGVGAGMTFPTLSGAAVGSVPGTRFALATALNSVARQVGAALGVALLIAIIGTPAAPDALHAFQHGWLFAAGCFIAGSICCVGLTMRAAESGLTSTSGRTGTAAAESPPLVGEPPGEELPALALSDGERAIVSPQSTADFLRNIPLFATLSEEILERVAAIAQSVSVAREEWLFREGDAADGVYVVRLGQLEVVRDGDDSARQTLNTLTRGAVLGELALLSDSARSASVRALRDSELLRIDRAGFATLLGSEPELALGLTRSLSAQLQASRAIPTSRRACPVTIALVAAHPLRGLVDLADELSRALCAWGKVAVLLAGEDAPEVESRAQAMARYAPLVERCEQDHDQVIMVCGPGAGPGAWEEFCLARADAVLAVIDAGGPAPAPERLQDPNANAGPAAGRLGRLRGSQLVACGVEPGSGLLAGWTSEISPAGVFALAQSERAGDVARMARRLSGRSLGVVLGGGGARAFAHLGELEVLLDAGMAADRVAGVSMGAFIGGLLALPLDAGAIDACCYEEWVRRNPINDYTVPRHGLIRGRKAIAMLDRTFGEVWIEELARPFYCASVNLRGNRLLIDRSGRMASAVGASIALPLIAPPVRRQDALLIDGSLLDNLPLEPMSAAGEGPVLAIDIKGGESPPRSGARSAPARDRRPPRMPSLPETMGRIALLSSANTEESARRFADMTIAVRVPEVGLLEFHQIDQARAAGREAASRALEDAPAWLLAAGSSRMSLHGRRSVIRV